MSRRVAWVTSFVLAGLLPGVVLADPTEPLPVPAAPAPPTTEVPSPGRTPALSYRELARAVRSAQRLHHYRYTAYPQRVRQVDNAMELAQAEASVLADRLRHYRQFASFGSDSPAYTAAQDARLASLAVEQRRRELQRERDGLSRERRSTLLLLQLEHLELLEQLRQQ